MFTNKYRLGTLMVLNSNNNNRSINYVLNHGVRHGQKSGRANTEYIVYKNYIIKQVGKNIISRDNIL